MTGSLPLDRNRTRTGSPLSEESELHLLSQEKVVWYENPGSSDFSKSWKKHLIHDGIAGFEAIAADLDNDGQLEVVVSTLGPCLAMPSGGICVFKHRGDPKGVWDMKIIKDDWNEAHQLLTLDVNSNGLKDIVGVANCATPHSGKNELRWWENLG